MPVSRGHAVFHFNLLIVASDKGLLDRGLLGDTIRQGLVSLRAVGFVGHGTHGPSIPLANAAFRINVYRLLDDFGSVLGDDQLEDAFSLYGETIKLPSRRFHGLWEG
jgi:hypothetical protein